MKRLILLLVFVGIGASSVPPASAGLAGKAIRETAEAVLEKFGRGAAGETVDQVAEATAKAVARHGDEAIPLLRRSGHAGFLALDEAGGQAPEVLKLYARKGDEAVWLISEPKKLSLFLKHGDSAADALIKHPGIADDLIGRFGTDAAAALNGLSRKSAQRLGMVADEGLLAATPRSRGLLGVVSGHGDGAMDFIWRNKGSLAVAAVLATFLADPQTYISGAKELVAEPVLEPIARGTNWTVLIGAVLGVVFLPLIAGSLVKAILVVRRNMTAR